jgi:hypothetical protein
LQEEEIPSSIFRISLIPVDKESNTESSRKQSYSDESVQEVIRSRYIGSLDPPVRIATPQQQNTEEQERTNTTPRATDRQAVQEENQVVILETDNEHNRANASSIFQMNKDEFDAQYTLNTSNTIDDMPFRLAENEKAELSKMDDAHEALIDLGIQLEDAPRVKQAVKLDVDISKLDAGEPTSALVSEELMHLEDEYEEPPSPSKMMPRPTRTPLKDERVPTDISLEVEAEVEQKPEPKPIIKNYTNLANISGRRSGERRKSTNPYLDSSILSGASSKSPSRMSISEYSQK